MYFPVANIEISPFLPFATAFTISLVCSMGGISGAFLLLPYQVGILGYTQPGVSATNQIFNILACPAGVWRYAREGRFLAPLALIIALGTLPGVFAGAVIRLNFLSEPRKFMCFAGMLLCFLGLRMLLQKRRMKSTAMQEKPTINVISFSAHCLIFSFAGEIFKVPVPGILLISFLVGIAGGAYGVGGGAIIAPILVAFYRLPVHALAGATLFATFLTSISGVIFFSLLGNFWHIPEAAPDWLLGLILGLGGSLGMYAGAALQKYIPGRILSLFLAMTILFLGLSYIGRFMLT